MASKRDEAVEAKSRLLGKARKIQRDLERYAAWGWVTEIESYERDDARLLRAIDSIYDLARKHGLGDDTELIDYRALLRREFVAARASAVEARRQYLRSKADRSGRLPISAEGQRFLDELAADDARRRARRGGS